MRKIILAIVMLLASVISACSTTVSKPSLPSLTTPTPRCWDKICIQEAVVIVDAQSLSVVLAVTDWNGQVNTDNPPQLRDYQSSVDLYQIGPDGTEKSILSAPVSGAQTLCRASNLVPAFNWRLVDVCGVFMPQSSILAKVKDGDLVRVTLKEFAFEQVVVAHTFPQLGSETTATNIAEAYLTKDTFGDISVTAFPKNQRVIRLMMYVANSLPTTKVKVAWTAVDVNNVVPANSKLGELEQSPTDNGWAIFTVSVPASGVWPVGKYKADLYLDNKLDRTLEFTIE